MSDVDEIRKIVQTLDQKRARMRVRSEVKGLLARSPKNTTPTMMKKSFAPHPYYYSFSASHDSGATSVERNNLFLWRHLHHAPLRPPSRLHALFFPPRRRPVCFELLVPQQQTRRGRQARRTSRARLVCWWLLFLWWCMFGGGAGDFSGCEERIGGWWRAEGRGKWMRWV